MTKVYELPNGHRMVADIDESTRVCNITESTLDSLVSKLNYYAEQTDVLNKIRAELHANAEMHDDSDYYLRDEWIDEIFDKYKERSEE